MSLRTTLRPADAMTDLGNPTIPLADAELARRLERAEGAVNAAFVEARARIEPESGAVWTAIDGVYAMFDGVASPLTQTFGLGLFHDVTESQLEAIEEFFASRGAPVFHETSPFLPPEVLVLLAERGYRPVELSTVLVRPTESAPPSDSPITVREIVAGEEELWARTAGEGWGSESAELAAFIEAFGRVIAHASGVHSFLAERDGLPVATASLGVHGDVALLAGASTIASARRAGAQGALLAHRLRFARERGIPLAMVVTAPGSGSQRNAERRGFRVCYTRTKWQLHTTQSD